MSVLAFDLGGTRLKAGLVAPGGRVERIETMPTSGTAEAALDAIRSLGSRIADGRPVDAAGLCVPGLVDGGRVVALPGKLAGIVGVDLAAMLREAFGAPAVVVNDAVAYALGEAGSGAAAGARRAVVMTIGTGVGTAVVEYSRPLGGGPLGGGILSGQIPITDSGRYEDTNGQTGTIEAACRAVRLVDYARDAGGSYADVPSVVDAYAAGEGPAVAGVERFRACLVRAVWALASAHAPDVVVVGGGPVRPGSALLDGVEQAVNERLFEGYAVRVAAAALADTAALVGLAHLALP